MDLIISSNNKNKINEIKKLLSSLDINVLSLSDINFNEEILETGSTFSQNSYIKAKTIFDKYHMPVIADENLVFIHIVMLEKIATTLLII